MKWLLTLLLMSSSLSGVHAQAPEIVNLESLQRILASQSDTTYVVNFWATWCVPCVKEFPAFQALAEKYRNEKVQIVMVSLDFASEKEKSLVPFLAGHPILARVMLLDEPDYNSWIDKVEKSWGGEIPVTLIINGAKGIRSFYGHDFTIQSLQDAFTKTIDK